MLRWTVMEKPRARGAAVTTGLGIWGAGCIPVLFSVGLEKNVILALATLVMMMLISGRHHGPPAPCVRFTAESCSQYLLSTSDLCACVVS